VLHTTNRFKSIKTGLAFMYAPDRAEGRQPLPLQTGGR